MALSITVNGGGTFSASMEEGPVSFTATLGAVPGPKGDTGATGPAGVVSATAPITYDSGTQTIGISATPTFTSVTATTFNATNVAFADATTQTTAFVGEARKEYVIARNSTGSTIAAGKVVYLSGATGNKPTVALALADSEATSARTIGITVESIANNADGKVIISGSAENIDTSAFSAGDTLYLSATTAGAMTTTLPAAPLHGVVIGIVTRANPSVGSIEVAINNYQELKELSDVSVADRANNDGLFWESISSTWRSKTVAEALGYTPIAINSLSASAPISYNSGTGAFTFDSSGFLLKADNLSGLASVSTARTNLGLGTMATETASNYLTTAAASSTYALIASPTFTGTVTIPAGASISGYLTTATAASTYAPLASPAFTGNPTAPTPATNDNNGSIATTAFVNAYAPAASTTTAGKVELATDDEAETGTSTSLAVTPSGLTRFGVEPNVAPLGITLGTAATSGTGASSTANFGFNTVITGPTSAVGHASVRLGIRVSNPGNAYSSAIDFSRPVWISGRINRQNGTDANSYGRMTLGKNTGTPTFSDPTTNAIGVEFNGTSTYLVTHNGTTLTRTLSSHTSNSNVTMHIVVYSDGAGNAKLFINGTEVSSNSASPTTKSATADLNSFQIDVENKNVLTGSTVRLDCSNLKVCTA